MPAKNESGMSLVELLVAIFLLGLVALAVAPLMLVALQTATAAQESTDLTALGAQQMESLRGLPFADPQLLAGGSITGSTGGYSLDPYSGDPNRYLRWQIVDERADRKRIALVVGLRQTTWGPPREVLMETIRTDLQ